MDNKKKLLIGGGAAAAVILIIVLIVLLSGGKETREDKTTTSSQLGNITTEENTTLKEETTENTTEATEVESSNETTDELSDEETTLAEESSSKEEETTTKKVETTTKKNETTAKQTTTKKQQTTSKQETTTQEQTTAKPKPKSGRIKECELALVDMSKEFWPDTVNEGSIYTVVEGMINPYLYQKNQFGWENMAIYIHDADIEDSEYYKNDDFAIKYPNDDLTQTIIRYIHYTQKYNQAIIDDCEKWVAGTSKYRDVNEFKEYLDSRYSEYGENSIFKETRNEEWYKKWCYWDKQLQEYRTSYIYYTGLSAITYEEDGYYTNVEEIYERLANEEVWYIDPPGFYCRWVYDANTDKTTIYVVTMYT